MATPRPTVRPRQNLLQRINARNPYLRGLAATPGEKGFATTADMFNSMMFVNDQLDRERFMEEDRLRKTNRNPQIIMQKKMILQQAGYDPKEADNLANDDTFWRPEWERFGIERPYPVNPAFGGTVSKRDSRFRKAREHIEDEVDLENYAQELQLNNRIAQERQIREAFPEDYFEDAAPGGRGRGSSRSSGSSKADDGQAIVAGANREAIINKGKPIIAAPQGPADPAMAYIGHNLSKTLTDAGNQRLAAESYFNTTSTDLRNADNARRAASAALKTAQKSNDPGAIAAATRAFQNAEASYFAADEKVADAERRLSAADALIKGARTRAEDAGLDVNDTTVFDAARGRVYKFNPPLYGPPAPMTAGQQAARSRAYREGQLGPGQKTSLNTALSNMDRAGVIDLEEDYFNPTGMRNTLTDVLLSGSNISVNPGTGGISVARGSTDPYFQKTGSAMDARTTQLSNAARRQARGFDDETNVLYLIQEMMNEDPTLSEADAKFMAVDAYQRGRRPQVRYFSR